MSHEVEKMFYVGSMPWHGIGEKVDDTISVHEAIIKAGLDDEVEKTQLSTLDTNSPVNFYATRRVSKGNILGFVGPDYTVLQNRDAFDWFQPYLDNNLCKLHTAGSLRDGARIWILAEIVGAVSEVVKNDYVKQFLMLSNGHDRKLSVRVGLTGVRVVCMNTLRMAHRDKSSVLMRVRHSSAVKANVDALRDVIDLAKREFAGTIEQYQVLARRSISKTDLEKYFRKVLNIDADKARKDLPTRTQNRIEELVKLFETGKGSNLPGVEGTVWGAYNAVTEQLTWNASRNVANRFDSLWFGPNDEINKRALDTAFALAV